MCMSRREGRCRGAERGVKLEYGTGSTSTTGSSKVQSVAVPWEDGIYLSGTKKLVYCHVHATQLSRDTCTQLGTSRVCPTITN